MVQKWHCLKAVTRLLLIQVAPFGLQRRKKRMLTVASFHMSRLLHFTCLVEAFLEDARVCCGAECTQLETKETLFKICSRCRGRWYCSKEVKIFVALFVTGWFLWKSNWLHQPPQCQKTDWRAGHRTECGLGPPSDPASSVPVSALGMDKMLSDFKALSKAAASPNPDDTTLEQHDEAFGRLLEQMKSIRENKGQLSDEDRRLYAEKVALSFAGGCPCDCLPIPVVVFFCHIHKARVFTLKSTVL